MQLCFYMLKLVLHVAIAVGQQHSRVETTVLKILIILFGPLETWKYLQIPSKRREKLTGIPEHTAVKI